MSKIVITAVSAKPQGLSSAVQEKIASIIKMLGVGNLQIKVLSEATACDILISETGNTLIQALRDSLSEIEAVDIFVQPNTENRRKKAIFSDMDSTILQGETIDELAAYFDIADQIKPITERAMRGEIGFNESYTERMALLRGKPVAGLYHVLEKLKLSKGAKTLIKTMRMHGAKTFLLSGGFDFYTQSVAQDLGFYKNFGNQLVLESDNIAGRAVDPILGRAMKQTIVMRETKDLGLPLLDVLTVGDGANDIDMLTTPDVMGISYFAKPAVEAVTPFHIRHTSLVSLLYLQGYRDDEISWVED